LVVVADHVQIMGFPHVDVHTIAGQAVAANF